MAEDDRKAPNDWAAVLFTNPRDRWRHDVASAAHGWAVHAYETGAPLLLSRADYEAAVRDPDGEPHAAALSPHAPAAKRGSEAAVTSKPPKKVEK